MKPYYQDEFVTLYHGDCLENTAWLEADVLVTDPPYGVEWKGYDNFYNNKRRSWQEGIAKDDSTEVRDKVVELWGQKPAVIFGSWKQPRPQSTRQRLIWHKKGQAPGLANGDFLSQDEEIYILGSGFLKTSPPMRTVIATTENRAIESGKIGHPTPKPIGLMELLIARCPQGVIADPFAGSGATLLASRNLGRRVIGIEIEEKYCELIANRLNQQTFQFEEA